MNYKIVLEYEGTHYKGWQRQITTENTLQGVIEEAISEVVGEVVEINGSGRTDAGTHATGQVANFKINRFYENQDLMDCINEKLPADIRILSCERVSDRFHARLNAVGKKYCYKIDTGKKVDVFSRRTINHFNVKLDTDKMREAAKILVGTHDFMSFCANKRMKKTTVRTIHSIDIVEKGTVIEFTFVGSGFLYNMVRILTGTLVEVGMGQIEVNDVKTILEAKDRSKAGMTMPPRGLTLVEVYYK